MESTNVNDLTQAIGKCGRFQVFLTLAVSASATVSVWGMIFMTFGIYDPGWICLEEQAHNIYSSNATEFNNYVLAKQSSLFIHDVNETSWNLNCTIKNTCQRLLFNSESSTIVTEWNLSCDLAYIPSAVISIQMIGVLIGSYISGQIGDRYGRKVSVYLHVFFHGVFHFIAFFSVSWQMYAVIIFFIGCAVGGIVSTTYPYVLEFVTEYWRGVIAAIPMWNIASTIFLIAVFIIRDWQYLHLITAITSVLVFLPVFWITESPRWLAVHGKVNNAKFVVSKIAQVNKRPIPDTQIIDTIANEEKSEMGGHKYNYVDLFRFSSIRGYTFKFGIIWFTMSLIYYFISFGIKALSGNFYINLFIFSIFDIPSIVLAGPAMNRFGRRKSALVYFILEFVCITSLVCICFKLVGTTKDMSILVLSLICKIIIPGAWAIIANYSFELYPTVLKTIHYGFLNSMARIGSIVSPYLVPIDPETIYVPFIIVAVFVLLVIGVLWTLPETKGRQLDERTHKFKQETKDLKKTNEQNV